MVFKFFNRIYRYNPPVVIELAVVQADCKDATPITKSAARKCKANVQTKYDIQTRTLFFLLNSAICITSNREVIFC